MKMFEGGRIHMQAIARARHVEATTGSVDTHLSDESSSPPSSSKTPHSSKSITCIGREFYNAAVEGDFNKFINVKNIEGLLTPNKNTVLHIHLTSTTSETTTQSVPQPYGRKICGLLYDYKTKRAVSEHFVQQILGNCGGLVLLPNAKGETPLHLAARYGHSTITKILIQHAKSAFVHDIESGVPGVEKKLLRATTENKDTALHEAVRYNHLGVVEILLEMDHDPDHHLNVANKANETPLYLASERKYKQIVRKILEKVETPAYEGPCDRTALHAAVINNDLEMTRDLLKNEHLSVALRHVDKKGWVPLHYAVKVNNKRLTKLLVEKNESTAYMQDNDGRTALHIAAYCGNKDIMEIIMRCYPDCSELVDSKGWNALHYAVNGKHHLSVAGIMSKPWLANLYNEKDADGNTPLHHLAKSQIQNRKLVFHSRVDKMALNEKDQTALDVAYATIEDSDRVFTLQALIMTLETAGAMRSQRFNSDSKHNGEGDGPKLEFTSEAKQSHLIVATLIATVTFAAAFTLPGGTIQDGKYKGSPILERTRAFQAFIISDTIALVLSASVVFIHLFSPLNKAKWLDHYLSEVAFSFILVSVATMMVAFATGASTVLDYSSIGIAIMVIGLSFFIVFKQVLRISFRSNFILTFMKNLMNIILFSFIRFAPRPIGCFFRLFRRSDQAERRIIV